MANVVTKQVTIIKNHYSRKTGEFNGFIVNDGTTEFPVYFSKFSKLSEEQQQPLQGGTIVRFELGNGKFINGMNIITEAKPDAVPVPVPQEETKPVSIEELKTHVNGMSPEFKAYTDNFIRKFMYVWSQATLDLDEQAMKDHMAVIDGLLETYNKEG